MVKRDEQQSQGKLWRFFAVSPEVHLYSPPLGFYQFNVFFHQPLASHYAPDLIGVNKVECLIEFDEARRVKLRELITLFYNSTQCEYLTKITYSSIKTILGRTCLCFLSCNTELHQNVRYELSCYIDD